MCSKGSAVSVSQHSTTGSETFCPRNEPPCRNDLPFSVSHAFPVFDVFKALQSPQVRPVSGADDIASVPRPCGAAQPLSPFGR